MNRETARTLAVIVFGWMCVFAAVTLFRPLMPVDETRYMTVAWEMLVRDTWLLPTLNYEPYSHKPPLLFWLIRGSWEIFGVGEAPVRAVLSMFIVALFALAARLAATLLPQDANLPSRSVLLLGALPLFLIYASMIMFDSLLTVFILCALISIFTATKRGGVLPWVALGVSIGFGILAKGPVMLVYTLPVALLAPLWVSVRPSSWGKWYAGIFASVFLGAAIALSWAIPAAITGGDAYAEKIFLKQSAGRMVNAFDHQQPFWFYFPVVLWFLAPIAAWPAFWQGLRSKITALRVADTDTRQAVRFLLCQIVPVFLFFSAISSKQIHYMLPLLPAASILFGLLMTQSSKTMKAGLPIVLTAFPSLILLCDYITLKVTHAPIEHWDDIMDGFLPWLAAVHIAVGVALGYFTERRPEYGLKAMTFAAFLLFVCAHTQLGQGFFKRYDLSILRPTVEKFEGLPIATAPKYDGEYGYVLRLKAHIDLVEGPTIDPWIKAHPDGIVIMRDNNAPEPLFFYKFYQSMPYRFDKRVAIIGYDEKKYPHWLK